MRSFTRNLSSLDAREKKHFGQKSDAQSRNIRLSAWLLCLLLLGTGIKVTTAAPDRHGALPAGHTTLRTVTATHNLLTGDSSRVDLTVKGEIPAQVRVSATPVQRTDVDGSPMLAAYDISLTDSDGQEWQPAYGHPVTVTITDPSFGNGRSLDIFHEGPEGREYVASVISVNNTVTFPAKHFSVYVVGNPDGRNRLVVMFYRANNPYADPNSDLYENPIAPEHQNIHIPDTVFSLVRRGDTVNNGEILESLIYPPGPGYLRPGVRFFGWSGRPDYSAELEDRMTIDIVRDSVYRRLLDTADKFNDLDTLKFFAVRLRTHNVYYRSFYNPRVVVGIDDILYPRDSTNVRPYVIHENYVPEDIDDYFNGWKLVAGDTNIVYGANPLDLYQNEDTLLIKGDLVFMVDISHGHWLTFNEVAKGASYTAPKFLKSDQITQQIGDKLEDNKPEDPTRFGYTFDGWYADSNYAQPFAFQGYLTKDTIIYAKWNPNTRASYTVMVWKQNLTRDGYDLLLSYSDSGHVEQTITQAAGLSTGTVGDLTYVKLDSINHTTLGGIAHVLKDTISTTNTAHNILHDTDPLTGFTLSSVNPIHDTVITPEGESVLNIYFDRVRYTLKLYVARTDLDGTNLMGAKEGDQAGNKTLTPFNSLAIDTSNYLGSWTLSLNYMTRINGELPANYVINGNYKYYYHTITAYYGEDISSQWVSYHNITCSLNPSGNRPQEFVSWILMPWAKSWVSTGQGGNTLKGDVSVMDEKILGNLADSTGNLITARYGTYKNWYYHLYLQDLEGNFPSEPNEIIYARSDGSLPNNRAKAPSVIGYRYNGTTTWTDNGEGDGGYIISHYYVPQKFSIIYMDGNYVNGNEQSLQNRKHNELHDTLNIPYGSDISSCGTYTPDLPHGEYGFVFEGWYADEACTQPYTFTTMPLGGVRVYAKWRQVQYRVFLHPQAGRDPSLNWGSDNQAMSFRVSYGNKVSPPMFGQRDLYTFGGWYTEPECTTAFFPEANPLNEQRLEIYGTDYVKEDSANSTDLIDKWGDLQNTVNDQRNPNGPNGKPYNSDLIGFNGGDRFWITEKLDLYAQWKYKFDGAEGAMVEYVCEGCGCVPSTIPVDNNLYLDKSKMVSMPGPTPSSPDSIFTYWIIQRWSAQDGKYVDSAFTYPGGPFILDLASCRREQITPDSAVYIFRLRANIEPSKARKTFIVWYRNIEDDPLGRNDTVRYDSPDTLLMNMEVSIPGIEMVGSREGYLFKGWHRKPYRSLIGKEGVQPEILIGNDTTNVNFLWYNPEDNQFYSASTFTPEHLAHGVAADELQPYHFLYAVWKPIAYTVRFNPNTDKLSEDGCDKMDLQDFTYDEEKNLLPNCFVWPCHRFLGWTFTSDGTGDTLSDQQLVKNLSLIDKDTVDLYAVWAEVAPTLTVIPDSATCVYPGALNIKVNSGTASYHYTVYSLDTTQTPAVESADPVWEATLDNEVRVPDLAPGRYRVKVVTATGCPLKKDTTIFIKPTEITPSTSSTMAYCGYSTFSIQPSSNPDVKYLWDAPIITPDVAGVSVTPGKNDTVPKSNISGMLKNESGTMVTVSYKVYPILGNCQLGDIDLPPINVGTLSPNYELSLSGPNDGVCAGESVSVTATMNQNIYDSDYTLHWVVNGDTTHRNLLVNTETADTTLTVSTSLCVGNYTVEAFYVDSVNSCRVNATLPINVVVKGWDMPADGDSTVACVSDTIPPHLLDDVMPVVTDGCGNKLTPTFTGRTNNLGLHDCSGTVTYTYQYSDCTGETKYWRYVYTIEPENPVLTITGEPKAIPDGNCRYRIPAIEYTVEGCGDISVTQNPLAGHQVEQGDLAQDITVTLTAIDACGNTDTKLVVLTIPAKPTISVEATPSVVCPGSPITLSTVVTGTDETPVWTSNPSTGLFNYTASDTTFTSNTPGSYTLTASVGDMASSCLVTSSAAVTVNPPVTLTATDTTQTVCKGEPIRLIHVEFAASNVEVSGLPAGVGFVNDPIDPNISGTPTEVGTFHYTITATSTKTPPCDPKVLTGTITVTETGGDITISCDSLCEEGTTTLIVSSTLGSKYTWMKGETVLESTTHTLTVSEAGTYSVTVASPHGGCISVGSITLTQHETKRDTLRETICDNLLPYAWGPVTFEAAGLHSDTLVSAMGCDSIVTRVLTVNANPEVQLASRDGICPNIGTLKLTAEVTLPTVSDYTYEWRGDLIPASTVTAADQLSDTAMLNIPSGNCNAIYKDTVRVTDGNGCIAEAYGEVKVESALPEIRTELTDKDYVCIAPPTPTVADFTVIDPCDNAAEVTLTHGDTVKNGCGRSLTWIATYENQCGQKADTVRVTYRWTETEKPTILAVNGLNVRDLGCNPP
ncbi:MAG: InlB B-repeat-containing protein, partial [Bacteroidales bacterium]|nr:InlB B-repeat-containing protein [Bacteroidales bacterium]